MRRRARRQGFTLLETLVMLVVSSLAVMLMFQALAGFDRSRQRVAALEGVRDNDAVVLGWIRDSFRGLVALAGTGKARQPGDPAAGLHGDADGFTALTLSPLLGPAGVPVTVRWSIRRDARGDALVYRETGHAPLTLPLRDAGDMHFAYVGKGGKSTPDWPPELGVQAAMPQAIELHYGTAGDPHVIHQALATPLPLELAPYTVEENE